MPPSHQSVNHPPFFPDQSTCHPPLPLPPYPLRSFLLAPTLPLSFPQENYDSAIFHFQQLMERSPTHYVALSNLIQVRVAGKGRGGAWGYGGGWHSDGRLPPPP